MAQYYIGIHLTLLLFNFSSECYVSNISLCFLALVSCVSSQLTHVLKCAGVISRNIFKQFVRHRQTDRRTDGMDRLFPYIFMSVHICRHLYVEQDLDAHPQFRTIDALEMTPPLLVVQKKVYFPIKRK